MENAFFCEICKYSTTRKYNMSIHYKSKRHLLLSKQNEDLNAPVLLKVSQNSPKMSQPDEKCVYCHKTFSYKKNLKRHYKSCQKIKNYSLYQEQQDIIINLQKDNRRLEEEKQKAEKEKKKAERELIDFMKDVVKNNKSITLNNNKTVNMFHIMQHYKPKYDYKELMNMPLTDDEINKYHRLGAEYAAEEMIRSRCIENMSVEERPIHCVDTARDKYVIRDNGDWMVDNNGEMIIEKTFPMLKQIFMDNSSQEINKLSKKRDFDGIDKILDNQRIAAETTLHRNDKKILKKFKNKISTKNIFKSKLLENDK